MSQNLKSDAIFKTISDRMQDNVEKAKAINGIFLVNITKNGQAVKKWTIDLKNLKLYEGAPKDTKADATLTVNDEDLVDVALGITNPQVAYAKGKLKISENVKLAKKLVPLLKTEAKL